MPQDVRKPRRRRRSGQRDRQSLCLFNKFFRINPHSTSLLFVSDFKHFRICTTRVLFLAYCSSVLCSFLSNRKSGPMSDDWMYSLPYRYMSAVIFLAANFESTWKCMTPECVMTRRETMKT